MFNGKHVLQCSSCRVDIYEQKMHKNDAIVHHKSDAFYVTDKMKIHQELTAGGKSREKPGM